MDKDNPRMRAKKEDKRKAIPIDPSPLIDWLLRWLLELTLKEVLKRVMQDAFLTIRRLSSSMMKYYQNAKIEDECYGHSSIAPYVAVDDTPVSLAVSSGFYSHLLFMRRLALS